MNTDRVLLVCTNADRAGAPTHVATLARGLRLSGASVSLAFGEQGPIAEALAEEGFRVHFLPTMRSAISPFRDIRSTLALCRIIRIENPCLIHCHSSKAGMVGRLAGALMKKPVIFTVHGWGFGPGRKRGLSRIMRGIEWLFRGLTSHYIAVSECDRRLGIETLKIKPDQITTVRNGVESEQVLSAKTVPRSVIMVARNEFPKDYLTLATAIRDLDVSTARFVGAGTEDVSFQEQCRAVAGSNAEKIEFMGTRSDVAELLAGSALFVLSSRFEGLPLSIIEAMSHNLPIVASDVGGVSELVSHGQNGFLVKAGDVEGLRSAMNQILNDDSMAERMGKSSRRRYEEEFSASNMIEKTLSIYHRWSN